LAPGKWRVKQVFVFQYESEHLFIHEHSVLNRQRHRVQELRLGSTRKGSVAGSVRGDVSLDHDRLSANNFNIILEIRYLS